MRWSLELLGKTLSVALGSFLFGKRGSPFFFMIGAR